MSRLLKILIGTLAGLCLLAVLAMFLIRFYQGPADSSDTARVTFTVKRGEGLPEIAAKLKRRGIIRSSNMFMLLAFIDNKFNKFYSGTYSISPSMDIRRIMAELTTPPPPVVEVPVLLKEGWTTGQYADALAQKGVCGRDEFLAIVRDPAGHNINTHATYGMDLPHLEGFLFPETYRFQEGKCLKAVRRMLNQFFKHFTPDHEDRAKALGLTPYEAVILASIVEKETRAPVELERVAGVFLKRMRNGWKLEADATFKYIDGEWEPDLGIRDPRAQHECNTYLIKGLPPRPIGNPGANALDATVNAKADTPYWYFVTKNDGTHQHFFSRSKEQHDHFIWCSNYNQRHEDKKCLNEAQ